MNQVAYVRWKNAGDEIETVGWLDAETERGVWLVDSRKDGQKAPLTKTQHIDRARILEKKIIAQEGDF